MDDEEIERWTEIELIRNIFHELRQQAAPAHGWIQILTDGQVDPNDGQFKPILLRLRENIENIVELERWMKVWVFARKDEDWEQ